MPDPETVVHVTDSPHSVEISRNASGGISFSVKVYRSDPQEAAKEAKAFFAQLDADYPVIRK